jgi:hypothetical protein
MGVVPCGWAEFVKLTVAFRNSASGHKKGFIFYTCVLFVCILSSFLKTKCALTYYKKDSDVPHYTVLSFTTTD